MDMDLMMHRRMKRMNGMIDLEERKKALSFAYAIITDKRNEDKYAFTALTKKTTMERFGYSDMLRVLEDMYEELDGSQETHTWQKMEWISVKDRMPDAYQHVIAHVRHTEKWRNTVLTDHPWHVVEEDIWLGDKWDNNADADVHEVTHWMPMPEPPKCNNENDVVGKEK